MRAFRRIVHLSAVGGLPVVLLWADPALAEAPDTLCGTGVAGAANPTVAALKLATEAAEARAKSRGATMDDIRVLDVPLDSTEAPDAATRAAYCTAAGEVMRLSPQGSQFQAQTYLLSGYRLAAGAGVEGIASLAAFRLGLVSSSGSAVTGARGGARSVRRSNAALTDRVVRSVGVADGLCSDLAAADLFDNANGYIAEVALQCAARRALRAGDPQLAALASLRLGRLRLGLVETAGTSAGAVRAGAIADLTSALLATERVPDVNMRGELIGRLLSTSLDLGSPTGAPFAAGLVAMREAAQGHGPIEAYANALEARAAILAGDNEHAKSLLGRAIFEEAQRPLPTRLPEYFLLLADADPGRGEEHAFAAYTALNNIRPLLPRTDPLTEESTFTVSMRKVFERAVEFELADTALVSEAVRIGKAQQIIEAYRQAELQSVFGSECLPVRNALRPSDLRANEILLYPILLPDRVELLYVSGADQPGGQVTYHRLPVNRSANRENVAKLSEQVVLSLGYGNDDTWREPARALYDLLIAPIEDKLRPGSMLVIIPDGALRAVPFAALPSADGQFLVQKARLSVAPALAFSQPGDPKRSSAPTIVAASLQQELTLPAGFFPRLEGTADEARIAAGSSRGGLFIADFKKADLVQALSAKPVDVLHLATHASFNGRSDRAFVVANGETIPLSELRALIAQNRARGDELALLVLSACETAVGDDEASMGLAGAAVQAGALSAIASLWQVNDAGTAELMKQFYARYSSGTSRSESLRDAQLALIGGGGANADPNIWAAFTLLGAWR